MSYTFFVNKSREVNERGNFNPDYYNPKYEQSKSNNNQEKGMLLNYDYQKFSDSPIKNLDENKNIVSHPSNLMTSSNFSFEKLIKKSNSMSSLRSPKNIHPLELEKIQEEENSNYVPEKKILRDYSNLNKTDRFYNYDHYINSNAHLYLERRHLEEMERLNHLRYEKMVKENQEVRDRPIISENSKFMASRKIAYQGAGSVFDRLTDKTQLRRKQEEINFLNKIIYDEKFKHKPKINKVSKNCQRDVNDLLEWKRRKEERQESRREKQSKSIFTAPMVDPYSEDLLKENNPKYLQMKVEDRLYQQVQK
jgi:hypothetical protein